MSKDNELDYDEAKKAIVEYLLLTKRVKNLIWTTIVASIAIILSVIGMTEIIFKYGLEDEINFYKFMLLLSVVLGSAAWVPIANGLTIIRFGMFGKKNEKAALSVQNQFTRRSYLINFEIVKPEGNSSLERLFNHLSLIFSEVEKINKKRIKKNMSIEKYKRRFRFSPLRNYDLVIPASTGFFVVKKFDKEITIEDVEKTVKSMNLQQTGFKIFGPASIHSLIIIGKKFDEYFDSHEFTEKIKNMKRKFRLDLILEESDDGYATIWIDK